METVRLTPHSRLRRLVMTSRLRLTGSAFQSLALSHLRENAASECRDRACTGMTEPQSIVLRRSTNSSEDVIKVAGFPAIKCIKKAVPKGRLFCIYQSRFPRGSRANYSPSWSGFRHLSSSITNRPSLRMSLSSNQISPPPYSGRMISTRSQWMAELLPFGASS